MPTQNNLAPAGLLCEYLSNPLGINTARPRLFWRLQSATGAKNVSQLAYRVLAATSRDPLSRNVGDLWDSGRVESRRTTHIPYDGKPVSSAQRVYWKVRVWDDSDSASPWSEPSWWETGLLQRDDWQAQWIGPQPRPTDKSQPAPLLRHQFPIDAPVEKARLYVAARGLCRPFINGERVGTDEFSPGWSSFNRRVQYVTYDVTQKVSRGDNALALLLGDGWYCGYLASFVSEGRGYYGSDPQVLAQLVIRHKDGHTETVATGQDWLWNSGAIRSSDIYNGEVYDARCSQPGWTDADFDASDWEKVQVYPDRGEIRTGKKVEPVRCIEELAPLEITEPEPGTHIYDMGQNMVGRARVKARGRAGQTITLRHGECLNEDGHLHTENLRKADQTNKYTFADADEVTWEPTFTFQGFRYVELSGLDYKPALNDIKGIVLHNDMHPTGEFECSDPRLNQLHHNIIWGQKGNYLEVPTDCPQRDERLGWTGDAQVFIRTACHNFNVASFITKWMDDLRDDQGDDGSVPHVAPDVLTPPDQNTEVGSAAAWADAIIIVPWAVYQYYGDRHILEDNYEAMA
ncbi:MAG: family 78 glycoside hydrolase catalytic domain, partial [Planctomycetota bacterium]